MLTSNARVVRNFVPVTEMMTKVCASLLLWLTSTCGAQRALALIHSWYTMPIVFRQVYSDTGTIRFSSPVLHHCYFMRPITISIFPIQRTVALGCGASRCRGVSVEASAAAAAAAAAATALQSQAATASAAARATAVTHADRHQSHQRTRILLPSISAFNDS